jgi:catechol 1,2-dioxygenase
MAEVTVSQDKTTASPERTAAVVRALMDRIRDVIVEHRVTYDEYAAAKQYVIDVGQAGEWPLFGDVFFESAVEEIYSEGQGVTGAIQGPYYVPGSSELKPPYALPMRDNEPGDPLLFSGSATGLDGTPIAGAVIDMWHSDGLGTYSNIPYPDDRELPPPYTLRGRFKTDANGRFELRTIVPVPYEIPKAGPTGALLRAAGWHAFRPAHLHCFVSAPGYQRLTSQLYFEGDPYIDSDVATAVKPGLVLKLEKHAGAERGLERPFFTTSYDFRLARA